MIEPINCMEVPTTPSELLEMALSHVKHDVPPGSEYMLLCLYKGDMSELEDLGFDCTEELYFDSGVIAARIGPMLKEDMLGWLKARIGEVAPCPTT